MQDEQASSGEPENSGNNVPSEPPSSEQGSTTPKDEIHEAPKSPNEERDVKTDNREQSDDKKAEKEEPPAANASQRNLVGQFLDSSQADIVATVCGDGQLNINRVTNLGTLLDSPSNLDLFITRGPLQSSTRSYQSVAPALINECTQSLLAHQILVLSCDNSSVALNIAKLIAEEVKTATRRYLLNIERNCQGNYTLNNLIERLTHLEKNGTCSEKKVSPEPAPTIWVWTATNISEGDASNTILDTLFEESDQIEHSQIKLGACGWFLICIVPPQKLDDHSGSKIAVQNRRIDFLRPLLEEYGWSNYDELAETILQQRTAGLWDQDNGTFYKQVLKCLQEGNLPDVVANRSRPHHTIALDQIFKREPIIDTVLYCATYFSDLSPQDFSYLVELFLGDATEEVIRKRQRSLGQTETEAVEVLESVPLAQRWRRDSDQILRACKLVTGKNENNERVVDFQVVGLRSRLRQYIETDHYFFYDSNSLLALRNGLLFNARKKIAEGTRQLLVALGTQYGAADVANWLYEIVVTFEKMAGDETDLPAEREPMFAGLQETKIKAARHLVCQELSLILTRLNKKPNLKEAVRLFWQKLLQTHQLWLLDLLRRLTNLPASETLPWLKQLLDRGSEEVRLQVNTYLIAYLLRRNSQIYQTLKELMAWSQSGQAGRSARRVLVIYCLESNRQLPQQEYGQWPSSHPLFGFQDLAEARESLDLLLEWLVNAAVLVYEQQALFVVADLMAGWYFILSPHHRPDPLDETIVVDTSDELDAQTVCNCLLRSLVRNLSREQKASLLAIWEGFKNAIQEEVLRLDRINELPGFLLDAKLMSDAKAARRKLLDTKTLLTRLRKDFISCAAVVVESESTQ